MIPSGPSQVRTCHVGSLPGPRRYCVPFAWSGLLRCLGGALRGRPTRRGPVSPEKGSPLWTPCSLVWGTLRGPLSFFAWPAAHEPMPVTARPQLGGLGEVGVVVGKGTHPPQSLPPRGRWAGEAGSDEGAILYPTFPCRKEGGRRLSPQRNFFFCPVGQPGRPHQSPSVTASPRGSLCQLNAHPYTKKSAPNQGT